MSKISRKTRIDWELKEWLEECEQWGTCCDLLTKREGGV